MEVRDGEEAERVDECRVHWICMWGNCPAAYCMVGPLRNAVNLNANWPGL